MTSPLDRLKEKLRQRGQGGPSPEAAAPAAPASPGGSALGRLRRVLASRGSGDQAAPAASGPVANALAALRARAAGPVPSTRKSPSSPRPAIIHAPEPNEAVEPGPATLAHGNEAPYSQVGAISFDPMKLSALETASPAQVAAVVPASPPAPGPARTEYALPDGGRLELGRSMGLGGATLAIHHPRTGRMRSLHLVDGTEVSAPIVQRHPSPTEDDIVLFAALAAEMGSAQAKADHAALLAGRPSITPPRSDRVVEIGWWVLRHKRHADTIVLGRKPFSGMIADYEQRELAELGIDIRSPSGGRAPYSEDRWTRLVAWARSNSGEPSAALSAAPPGAPVRSDMLPRMKAAERIAALLRTRSYAAEVLAPAGASGPIRVAVAREGADPLNVSRYGGEAVGWIWMLLDGRLRIEPASVKDGATVERELEQVAHEALAGLSIQPTERDKEVRTLGPFEVLEDEAGGWIARARDDDRGESFVTLREAEAYAKRVGAQRVAQAIPIDATARIQAPTRAGPAEGGAAVTFDFGAARIDRWKDGAPVVALPFELRDSSETRRGELQAWERVDRDFPGSFQFVRGYINEDGERWGAQAFGASVVPAWVRDVMRPLIAAIPAQVVDFDGARVEPVGDGVRVRFDDEPSERTRHELRRGRFRRVEAHDGWVWMRDRDRDSWWWARHVAFGVQREREAARDKDHLPASKGGEVSHRTYDATDDLRTARTTLASMEQHTRQKTRSIVRNAKVEGAEREVRGLLAQRDSLQELVRLYREDGSRRPMGETAPEMRDFHAPLPARPTRVARGIDIWEHGGRVRVRLGAEPGEWLARMLHLQGFSRSRKHGEDHTWWQASGPLATYWAHWIAEHEAEKDANSPELVAERFAGELPAEDAWTFDTEAEEPPLSSTSPDLNPPVVTISMRLGERIVALAEPGKDAQAWEQAAREELAFENEVEREQAVRAVRDRVLQVEGGAIVGNDWLIAFKRAWASGRRMLLAVRLFADQPIVVAAATLARDRRERAELPLPPNDADIIPDDALEALLPAGLSAGDRQRGRRALGDALVALGLAERRGYKKALHTTKPNALAAPWGWLIRHEMRRDRRVEMPEMWALRESLAARLLGYSEGSAQWAMDAAIGEGWFTRSYLAGSPRIFFSEMAEKPAPPAPEPELPPVPVNIEAKRAAFAEKREARIAGLRAAGEKRMAEGEALYQQTKRLLDMIPMGQPNIVDTVTGRRFMRQRERLHERHERSWGILDEGRKYLARAAAAEANTAISSDDPDAIEKLKEQIAEREAAQEHAKEINAAVRAGNRAKLTELGLSEARIAKVFEPDFAGRVGIPPYALVNNNAQIRRLRERVALLEKQRREGPKEPEKYGAVEVREEDNRVRIFFPSKPSDQDRETLKRHGFKWAPSVPAWQRHANPMAWHDARQIARRIGGPPAGETGAADAAEPAGASELAKLVMRIITRTAEQSSHGLADVGNVVDEARTFAGKDKEQVHAALRELEDAGLVELRSWGAHPPSTNRMLAPLGPGGAPLLYARPLTPAKPSASDDPIIGYRLLLTMVVDHPERRDSTYPVVPQGHHYDEDEYMSERASADRHIEELRVGSTRHDSGSEYAAEIGLAAVTRDRRWTGWVVVPEPRDRPAAGGAEMFTQEKGQ